jgi:hypothetical protein
MKTMEKIIAKAIEKRNLPELALGYVRYEILRRVTPFYYKDMCDRCMRGKRFDDLVDELVMEDA